MIPNRIWQLLARKLSGEAGLDELRELELLLKDDPGLAYKVHLYTRYFQHPPKNGEKTEKLRQRAMQHFHDRLNQEVELHHPAVVSVDKRRSFGLNRWLVAAGVAVMLVVSGLIYNQLHKANTATHPGLFANEFKTMPGTRSKTVLPDGSVIWLNSESSISYNKNFGVDKREVILKGEAFFDVAHNASVPFVVHAQTVNITVKGTAFNVRSYPESKKVQTSLLRGAVELTTQEDPSHPIQLKPNEKITILTGTAQETSTASQPSGINDNVQAYRLDTLKQSRFANVIPEVSWVNNQLVFDNEVFSDVMDKMEKWYNVEIVLLNESLRGKSFSGDFEKEDIQEALAALQYVHHFEFEVKGRKIIIK